MSERRVLEVRTDFNNGVQAICTEETNAAWNQRRRILEVVEARYETTVDHNNSVELISRKKVAIAAAERSLPPSGPIFTFAIPERVACSPWFTGAHDDCRRLILHLEHTTELRVHQGLFVPFSNGCELGYHGPEALESELKFVTSPQQFRETWGISIQELRERYPVPPRR